MTFTKSGWIGTDFSEKDVQSIEKGLYLLIGDDGRIYYVGCFEARKKGHRLNSKLSNSHHHHLLYFLFQKTFFEDPRQEIRLSSYREESGDQYPILKKIRKSHLFQHLKNVHFSIFVLSLDNSAIEYRGFHNYDAEGWEQSLLFHIFLQTGAYPIFNSLVPSIKSILEIQLKNYDKFFDSDETIYKEVMKLVRLASKKKKAA